MTVEIIDVLKRYADRIAFKSPLVVLADRLVGAIPLSGLPAGLTIEALTELACEACVRKAPEYPEPYLRGVFVRRCERDSEQKREEKARARSTSAESEFLRNANLEMEAADREIRAMPESRHRRVEAINEWTRNRARVPCPYWALYGADSPEEYEAAQNVLRTKTLAKIKQVSDPCPHEGEWEPFSEDPEPWLA